MAQKCILMKGGVLLMTFTLAIPLLNGVIVKTEALGGISLVTALADEFRIHALPLKESVDCRQNRTHLFPHCEGDFYGFNDVRLKKTHIRINSLGFRGREYPSLKSADTYRIFILGDSFSFGEGVDELDTYPHLIEERISTLPGGRAYEVFNLGSSGGSTDSEYQRLLSYLDYSPDLIILQTLSNDPSECEPFRDEVIEPLGFSDEHPHGLTTAGGGEIPRGREQQINDPAQRPGMGGGCSCVRHYLHQIIATAERNQIPLLIYDLSGRPDQSCFTIEESQTVNYLSGIEVDQRKYWLSRKDTHPNKEGHRKMAEDILQVLTEIINPAVNPP